MLSFFLYKSTVTGVEFMDGKMYTVKFLSQLPKNISTHMDRYNVLKVFPIPIQILV